MYRFEEGLSVLGVLQELRQHPEVFREAFVEAHGKQEALTAETVEKLFTVNWSEEGSDRFRREKKVISHWADFLQDLGTFSKFGISIY